jgi:putative peptidoglycan lipid II flippase
MSNTEVSETATSSRTSRLISASAIMAAGTLVSRVLGFGRLMLLVFLFGNGTRQAEMFTLANTIPNSMYILLAGGVLNTVLVPQIVRAIKGDADRGEAYTNRIMTVSLIALGLITIVLTLAVPWILSLYTASGWKSPKLTAQYDSMITLGYYCMPQVFFYGVYVLAGQVLNARDKFGPMMWAPIANNLVSISVLLTFLVVFGRGNTGQAFSTGEELLLGVGSTLGIAMQAAVLVPFLRAAGYHYRPRFDFRRTGLGKTFRLAKWTLGFVLVNQLALVVINRLASGATVGGAGAGLAAYYNAYAVWILPHSLITVSLATAMLPAASRLAAARDLPGVADETTRAMRLAVTALLPAAVGFFALGLPIAEFVFGFGQGAKDAHFVGWALMALALGLVPFTVQYLCLRAFYALEDNRTTFFLQLIIAGTNVILGVSAVALLDRPELVATGLAAAYAAAYAIGVAISFRLLGRKLPALDGRALLRFCARLLVAAAPAAAVGYGICWALGMWSESKPARLLALVVAGVAAVLIFALLAHLLRIREVNQIVATLLRRDRAARPPNSDDWNDSGDSTTVIEPVDSTIETAAIAASGAQLSSGPTEMTASMSEAATLLPQPVDDDSSKEPAPSAAPQATASDAQLPAAALPAGTVLARRYRLEELIRESPPTVTWRAFDQVLSRSVLVHLLYPDDPDAPELLAVARKASAATDSRFLRVLDVVHSESPTIGSYIVSEYALGQSLELILSQGPLSGLEAAWVTRQVADALAGVHSLRLYHERINPDTVIITSDGNVKIVGLLIEAALRPPQSTAGYGVDSPEHVDVLDLGRLLYACLVCRWPGGPAYGLPDAPVIGHRWATPRQVRAGVSPALDNLCDQILGDPPRHHAERISTANALVNALNKVLGPADASGDLERRLRQPAPRVSDEPNAAAAAAPEPEPPTIPAAHPTTKLSSPVPTPPVPRPRPRRWIPLLVVLALLLVVGGVIAALAVSNRGSTATSGSKASTQSSTSAAPTGQPGAKVAIADARDFDPQGDDQTENPQLVKLAYDGDPATGWRTVRYFDNPKLGGIKRGVGLMFDLGSAQPVRTVVVTLSGNGTNVELRVPKKNPETISSPPMSSDSRWRRVAKVSGAGTTATLTTAEPALTRYVLVYLTSLPKEGTDYRGGINEVAVSQ